jgi:DNA-binding NtrC family response regulator
MGDILIIDDDRELCRMMSRQLGYMGHQVTAAYMIRDGLKMLQQSTFDVLFLDVRLPDGHGIDALPKIKASPNSPEVIVLTAFMDSQDADTSMKSGVWIICKNPLS